MKKIYIIGIEGAGTSALAVLYKNLGYEVSGSDDGDHFYNDILEKNGIKVFNNYNARNLPEKIDLIVYSTSIKLNNPEFQEAEKRKFKMLSYPEALAEIFNQRAGIAVCGTHGKTTITAMLAQVLKFCGQDPSAVVGSKVRSWQGNSLTGKGEYFVIEADEYQNKLKHYNPFSVILSSVDYDHPDFYETFSDYKKAFADFVFKIPRHGFLVYCNDDRDVVDVAKKAVCQKVGYGFQKDSEFRIKNLELRIKDKNIKQFFEIFYEKKSLGNFEIKLPGKYNALNATGVIALCYKLGLDMEKVREAVAEFQGTARRFEYIGERNGAILVDDYAHHPEEVKAVLKSAREIYPDKKISVIFHPHSFTRTEALLEDFAQSFDDCDSVFILDIYGSARESEGNISSKDLARAVNKYNPGKAEYIPTIPEAIEFFADKIKIGDALITMGAGDVWRVAKSLKQ